ncbi:MAG: bifunctional phosphoribosylaminoimidazolecarboxamide formyltransferase/IMP cyclohydrolase [Omnitrophica bacterium GWA2_52_12]|nr:MAG: bifunctional phosphoribosylaminoimidazolecarboxamide formyltransferase/IMP cyclohydrolase [Omnitrophica bacterium GWA2_52_12]
MSQVKIKRALISVSDKNGLMELAAFLDSRKVEIFSTGGTLRVLQEAGIKAKPVEKITGFPEMMDGRVKTLHPKIHGGLLFRRDKASHKKQAAKHGIKPIDLVVVNLYPFEAVTAKPGVALEDAVENIDIGGPSMLRSAAKNYAAVTVVTDPADYSRVLDEMKKNQGAVSAGLRAELALKVFQKTSAYDGAIAAFLAMRPEFKTKSKAQGLPAELHLDYRKTADLRYGENPHQRAAFYAPARGQAALAFQQHHGKELSFNNYLDMEAAVDILREFKEPAVCVIKHNNPSGIGQDADLVRAMEMAVDSDPLSAFGGIVGINRRCDLRTTAALLAKLGFFEVIVAPTYEPKALEALKSRKNLRIMETGALNKDAGWDVRILKSGALVQDRDQPVPSYAAALKKDLKFVTKAKLSGKELEDLIFAWTCAKVVKSNAIVLTQGRKTVGIGAGQMSRVDSVHIACRKAGERARGAMLGSDAFFPMPDGVEAAAANGIRAIIQPGGSIKDPEVIAACDRMGVAMAFTGRRHFKH